MYDSPVDVGGGETHTHPTLIITRVLSLSLCLSLFVSLSRSLSLSLTLSFSSCLTHTDIGEGVQESRHVATPDCHIQNSHDAGTASCIEAANCSLGSIAP